MQIRYCDICKEVLKGNVYFVAYQKQKIKPPTKNSSKYEVVDIDDFQTKIKRAYDSMNKIKYQEVCEECFKVVEKLFKLRVRKLKRIKQELEKMEKLMEEEEK